MSLCFKLYVVCCADDRGHLYCLALDLKPYTGLLYLSVARRPCACCTGDRGCGADSCSAGQAAAAHLALTGVPHVDKRHDRTGQPALHPPLPCLCIQAQPTAPLHRYALHPHTDCYPTLCIQAYQWWSFVGTVCKVCPLLPCAVLAENKAVLRMLPEVCRNVAHEMLP